MSATMKKWVMCAAGLVSVCVFGATSQAQQACDQIPHMDHPHVMLKNGDASALLFLPDAKDGYYRGARFDWSGAVGCYAYKGHTFFGEWFSHYSPEINDAITGPVEEFRSPEGAQGYNAAKPGDLFVKIGVGTLRKVADEPYKFGFSYPIVDTGTWTTHVTKKSVRYVQILSSPTGVHYRYEKTLSLDEHGQVLKLEHKLTNLGSSPIVTDVYDHDFFMLDGQPTGPGFTLKFPFKPVFETPLDPLATLHGQELHYEQELQPKQTAASYITGYGSTAADYHVILENSARHISVEQTSTEPVAKMYLWSIRSTICPEMYMHLDVPPGKSRKWTIRYRFQA